MTRALKPIPEPTEHELKLIEIAAAGAINPNRWNWWDYLDGTYFAHQLDKRQRPKFVGPTPLAVSNMKFVLDSAVAAGIKFDKIRPTRDGGIIVEMLGERRGFSSDFGIKSDRPESLVIRTWTHAFWTRYGLQKRLHVGQFGDFAVDELECRIGLRFPGPSLHLGRLILMTIEDNKREIRRGLGKKFLARKGFTQ